MFVSPGLPQWFHVKHCRIAIPSKPNPGTPMGQRPECGSSRRSIHSASALRTVESDPMPNALAAYGPQSAPESTSHRVSDVPNVDRATHRRQTSEFCEAHLGEERLHTNAAASLHEVRRALLGSANGTLGWEVGEER